MIFQNFHSCPGTVCRPFAANSDRGTIIFTNWWQPPVRGELALLEFTCKYDLSPMSNFVVTKLFSCSTAKQMLSPIRSISGFWDIFDSAPETISDSFRNSGNFRKLNFDFSKNHEITRTDIFSMELMCLYWVTKSWYF